MLLGKSIGGVPLSTMLCKEEIACFQPSDQGGTYNDKRLMTAINGAVLKALLALSFLPGVREEGAYLRGELLKLTELFGLVAERGKGLLRALKLGRPSGPQIVTGARYGAGRLAAQFATAGSAALHARAECENRGN
jgi:acetylornithine/N-succinyldiaminopimelate aminotransferase